MLLKWQDGCRTPLQDEGETPVMDLVKGAADPIRIQRPEVRVCVQKPRYTTQRELRCRFGDTSTETETDSCQCWSWTTRRMYKLSETKGRWTSLRQCSRWLHHDGNKQSKCNARTRSKSRARRNMKLREDWLIALLGEQLLEPNQEPNDAWGWRRGSRRFSGPGCDGTWAASTLWSLNALSWQTCFLPRFTRESFIKMCNLRERRSVEIHTCCQPWHVRARCAYEHSCFQFSVLIKCNICSCPHWCAHSAKASRKRSTSYDTVVLICLFLFKFRHVVNNDTIMHAEHTCTVAFSTQSWPNVVSVLILTESSQMRTLRNGSRKRFTACCDKVITFHHGGGAMVALRR